MNNDILDYNNSLAALDKEICELLEKIISKNLKGSESKIWHAHPVWFLNGNPIVGYSKQKDSVRLMFWSGVGFDEERLVPGTGKFKDASIVFTDADQVNEDDLKRWLKKSSEIQWDYKNIVKRKGILKKL